MYTIHFLQFYIFVQLHLQIHDFYLRLFWFEYCLKHLGSLYLNTLAIITCRAKAKFIFVSEHYYPSV